MEYYYDLFKDKSGQYWLVSSYSGRYEHFKTSMDKVVTFDTKISGLEHMESLGIPPAYKDALNGFFEINV